MSQTLDQRARDASEALRTAAELRPEAATLPRTRVNLRVAVTAAVVVVAVSVGAVIAFRSSSTTQVGGSGGSQSSAKQTRQYKASAVLIANAPGQSQADLQRDASLLTIGVVPRRAAGELHFVGDPARLAAQVRTAIDLKLGTITISSIQPTAARANLVANTFAEQLVAYLDDVAKGRFNFQVAAALSRQTSMEALMLPLRRQLDALKARGQTNGILEARYQAWLGQLRIATTKYQTLVNEGGDSHPYRLIESTKAVPLVSTSGRPSKTATQTLRNHPTKAGPFPDMTGVIDPKSIEHHSGGPYLTARQAADIVLKNYDCRLGGHAGKDRNSSCEQVDVRFFDHYASFWAVEGGQTQFVGAWGPDREMYVVTIFGKLPFVTTALNQNVPDYVSNRTYQIDATTGQVTMTGGYPLPEGFPGIRTFRSD